jgi:hypothetical protein
MTLPNKTSQVLLSAVGSHDGVKSCAGPYVMRDVVDSSDSRKVNSRDALLNPSASRPHGGDAQVQHWASLRSVNAVPQSLTVQHASV